MIILCMLLQAFVLGIKHFYKKEVQRSASNLRVRNNWLSHLYIIIEMTPAVLGSGVTLLFVRHGESFIQIIATIVGAITIKHYTRALREKFMDDVSDTERLLKKHNKDASFEANP